MCSLLAVVLISLAVASPALSYSRSRDDYDYDDLRLCEKRGIAYGVRVHPYECDQYVLCKAGETYEVDCPSRDVRYACSVSDDRNCHDGYYYHSEGEEGSEESETYGYRYDRDYQGICERKDLWDGVYPHPHECGKYVRCHHGVTQELVCPSDDVRDACDEKDSESYCDGDGWYGSWHSHDRDADFCEARGLRHGVYADADNCYGYIVCVYGRTNYIPCPAGTAFSRHERYCANEYHVDCDNHGHWFAWDSEVDGVAKKE